MTLHAFFREHGSCCVERTGNKMPYTFHNTVFSRIKSVRNQDRGKLRLKIYDGNTNNGAYWKLMYMKSKKKKKKSAGKSCMWSCKQEFNGILTQNKWLNKLMHYASWSCGINTWHCEPLSNLSRLKHPSCCYHAAKLEYFNLSLTILSKLSSSISNFHKGL